MMIPNDYLEKVYASILAMNAGIRLGAPVEPPEWTAEMIQDVFGDITDYVKDYNVFQLMTMQTVQYFYKITA